MTSSVVTFLFTKLPVSQIMISFAFCIQETNDFIQIQIQKDDTGIPDTSVARCGFERTEYPTVCGRG